MLTIAEASLVGEMMEPRVPARILGHKRVARAALAEQLADLLFAGLRAAIRFAARRELAPLGEGAAVAGQAPKALAIQHEQAGNPKREDKAAGRAEARVPLSGKHHERKAITGRAEPLERRAFTGLVRAQVGAFSRAAVGVVSARFPGPNA